MGGWVGGGVLGILHFIVYITAQWININIFDLLALSVMNLGSP